MAAEEQASAGADETAGSSQFAAMADALKAAAQSVRDGAKQLGPSTSNVATRTAYNGSYYVTYGMVFPAALLWSVLPKENAVAYGLMDGAKAAKSKVDDIKPPK